ncbi:hypothetical protein EU805_12585 [Salipiger sp. IMCC34102]|nr:hypothetical protein EU805_12585 [Salipiger sp. IMCC34102]
MPQLVDASAWPRGEENSFFSLSYQYQLNETEDQDYGSIFAEYGLTEALTFGLDLGYNPVARDRSGIVFLRQSYTMPSGPDVYALELGVGVVDISDNTYAVVRPGASWGRGWQSGDLSGWAGIEASYAFRGDGSQLGKVDVTGGIAHEGGSLSLIQIQTSKPSDNDWVATLAPSYVYAVEDDWFLEIGTSLKLSNGAKSFKLGVWREF